MIERIRYWESRRLYYNLVLGVVFVFWVARGWSHFRSAFSWGNLATLAVLALIANLLYCAAYAVDFIFANLSFGETWQRHRWVLLLLGILLAVLLESYWINDEIMPGLR